MAFKRFSLWLILRVTLILLSLSLLAWFTIQTGYVATSLLLGLLTGLQCWSLLRYVQRTNVELTRFFNAARYADFHQQFDFKANGTGFDLLGDTFSDILDRIRLQRTEQEQNLRHLRALLEHVPVPLISLAANGDITQWNNAARRLFGSPPLVHRRQLERFGEPFARELTHMQAGDRRLLRFIGEDTPQQLIVTCAQIIVSGYSEKLISLQDIQSELEGAQLQAWQDLVRVLTHEIMNSITPVSSLAQTASALARELEGAMQQPDRENATEVLQDLQQAVFTLARRSDNLLGFVSSYRQMTRLPPPAKQRLALAPLLQQIATLMHQELDRAGITVTLNCHPSSLAVEADAKMLEQLLINLVRNAQHALAETPDAQLRLSASLNKRGRSCIQVADNGPGISAEVADKMFVPFFTTKPEGSGVGLALSRQIMLAHGGTLSYQPTPGGGATFTLNF